MSSGSSSRSSAVIKVPPRSISPSSAARCKAWAALAGLRSRRKPRTGSASERSRCSHNMVSSDMRNSPMFRPCWSKSEADRQAMAMLFARTEYGRPYFLPPDVPMERVAALRRAFDATMTDPAFIADAARLQFDVDPLTGEQVQALVGELAATPREVVARVRAALETAAPP